MHFKQVESTNLTAEKLLTTGEVAEGAIIFADYQTNGRGVGANSWHSQAGANVLMSMVFQPEFLSPSDQFVIQKVVSLGVSKYLNQILPRQVKIKWPNDIYVDGKKLAGILGKSIIQGSIFSACIMGLGLNVNQVNFPGHLHHPVSLANITGKEYDRLDIARQLASFVFGQYRLLKNGDAEMINSAYLNNLLNYGAEATYSINGEVTIGIIRNVDHFGKLILETSEGIQAYDMKEIALVTDKTD